MYNPNWVRYFSCGLMSKTFFGEQTPFSFILVFKFRKAVADSITPKVFIDNSFVYLNLPQTAYVIRSQYLFEDCFTDKMALETFRQRVP